MAIFVVLAKAEKRRMQKVILLCLIDMECIGSDSSYTVSPHIKYAKCGWW